MTASYGKPWKLLIDRDLLKHDLRKMPDVSPTTMAKLGKSESVNVDILLRICAALEVDISDIVEVLLVGKGSERKGTGLWRYSIT
jgi:DNA-binding Xre family transcriptional regulator